MSLTQHIPNPPCISNVSHALERRDLKDKLIAALRTVAFYGSLQAYDEPGLRQRCSLARLIVPTDEVLRLLVNPPEVR